MGAPSVLLWNREAGLPGNWRRTGVRCVVGERQLVGGLVCELCDSYQSRVVVGLVGEVVRRLAEPRVCSGLGRYGVVL